MSDTAYRKRLIWAQRLLKDVMATLGSDAGVVWWRNHRTAIKKNLAAVQREWNDEKRALRPKDAMVDEPLTPPTTEPIIVRFVRGPLDGEVWAMQRPIPSTYVVQRFLQHDARYHLRETTYYFEGEPTQ